MSLARRYQPPCGGYGEAWMLESLLRTVVKIAVASLIVGTILAHFGITIDLLMAEAGFAPERLADYLHKALAWALPNLLLGAVVIVPIWFLVFLFRPPGASRE